MATSPHVLLVDDSLLGCVVSSAVLYYNNIRVTAVASCERALMFLAEHDVDLILTNYYIFDGMSGYELLREVKESPELRNIPVVVVFTDESLEVVEMCMDAGGDGYIFKPIRGVHVPLIISLI